MHHFPTGTLLELCERLLIHRRVRPLQRLALFQQEGSSTQVDLNLAAMALAAKEASEAGCSLIVFPELFLGGRGLDRVLSSHHCQLTYRHDVPTGGGVCVGRTDHWTINHARQGVLTLVCRLVTSECLQALAQVSDIAIAVGYPELAEQDGERLVYNSVVVVSSAGEVLSNCHKRHFSNDADGRVFDCNVHQSAGFHSFDFGEHKLAVLTGEDILMVRNHDCSGGRD